MANTEIKSETFKFKDASRKVLFLNNGDRYIRSNLRPRTRRDRKEYYKLYRKRKSKKIAAMKLKLANFEKKAKHDVGTV